METPFSLQMSNTRNSEVRTYRTRSEIGFDLYLSGNFTQLMCHEGDRHDVQRLFLVR